LSTAKSKFSIHFFDTVIFVK